MPYREELQALETRKAALEHELSDVRSALDSVRAKRPLPMLEDIRIASPCKASWDDMTGDERVRFCGQCAKNVYNLSAMPREEAELLLQQKEGNVCVRLYRRADGTVMTADCPVGVRRKRRRRVAAAAVGSGLMATAAAMFGATAMMGEPRPVQGAIAMGSAVVPEPPAPVRVEPEPTPPSEVKGHAVLMGAPVAVPDAPKPSNPRR